ncbi:MFS transporter [Microbacterium sediminicola]|uniref:MFS transporter n=1 Tax=Microbacterium sediminicola TaxID=415210 RepID=A0ABN2IGI6_9MICO
MRPLTKSPWPALWALIVGFFMILVDTTIVSVANPAIKASLDPDSTDLDSVIWVTSAYLLAYAVPLLITGRLGDRFGPKRIYLIGLAIFTAASLACGFSATLEALILWRAVQGLGAALMSPQTMAVITRTFPIETRGTAMGFWGAVSGVAMLVGPLAGGLLVDGLGWEWIFFVNIPVGIIAFVLAVLLVPSLPTHPHRFDLVGVFLSAAGLFFVVFALQEAEAYDWGEIWGPVTVWMLLVAGVVILAGFVWQQSRTRSEPLVPLKLFRIRTFALATTAIAAVGLTTTALGLPIMFYLQLARDLTPTQSALMTVPMALAVGIVSPFVGRLIARIDVRWVLVPGISLVALSLGGYALLMVSAAPVLWFLVPSLTLGLGSAGMWGPLTTTTTRELPPREAGAGSGVYNAMRTVGSVIGSAAIAALIQARIEANFAGASVDANAATAGPVPEPLREAFGVAMAQSMILPMVVAALAVVVVAFLPPRRPRS